MPQTTLRQLGRPVPMQAGRNRIVAIDHLRGFVILLVVLHHTVLAYCRYGHFDRHHYLASSAPIVDGPGWLGFDILVLFNDSYFMPLLFLLSGLFVWPSLTSKGIGAYYRDRLLRLGLPFGVAVLTVVPLAYYPSMRMTGAAIGFPEFWVAMIADGPWPSGPPWFIAVLLAFDLAAVPIYLTILRGAGGAARPIPARMPACFGWLAGMSALFYLPLLILFGPAHWFVLGPFAVQASRIGLYALYFFAGVEATRRGIASSLLAPDGPMQRQWAFWSIGSATLFVLLVAVQALRLTAALILPPFVWLALYGVTLTVFCAATCFALAALFLRFDHRSARLRDSLAANAYGIYLLHYPIVVWMQYGMIGTGMASIPKAALVFLAALCLTWATTIALRRIPGVARIV